MTTPAPGAQIVMGTEKFQEILCHTLVHIEIGAKRRIEALNGAGSPVACVQEPLDRVQEGVGLGAEQRLNSGIGTGEQALVLVTLPIRRALLAAPTLTNMDPSMPRKADPFCAQCSQYERRKELRAA